MAEKNLKRVQKKFNKKIRNKLLVRILITVSLLILLLMVVTLFIVREQFVLQLNKEIEYKVALTSSQIEKWLSEKKVSLENMAHIIASQKQQGFELEEKFFKDYVEKNHLHALFMGFADGHLIHTATVKTSIKDDVRDTPWYLMAVYKKGLNFLPLHYDLTLNKIIVTLSMPVYVEGKLLGVVGMNIPTKSIFQEIHSLKIGKDSQVELVDEAGIYIINENYPDKVLKSNILQEKQEGQLFARFMANKEGLVIHNNEDYIAFHRIPLAAWTIIFYLPSSEVNKPLENLYFIFGISLALTMLILVIAISIISTRISKPILDLVKGANQIVEENYGQALKISSQDEIGFLTDTFNEMSLGLQEREFIRSTFGRYVSEDVAKKILNSPNGLEFGGEKENVTILMSDLRGFTSTSEKLAPETVISLLNNYLGEMSEIIIKYQGTIDEFIGDAILVIFGSPLRFPDHAARAVACAIEMQNAMPTVNEWNKNHEYPEINMGIGINTGYVVVGNIGSEKRSKFGVVGKHVNQTSRIESYTIGGQIFISEKTKEEVGSILTIEAHYEVRSKGIEKFIPIYSVDGIEGDFNLSLNKEVEPFVDVSSQGLRIKCYVLEGKDIADNFFEIPVTQLSHKEAIVKLAADTPPLEMFSNLYFDILNQDDSPLIKQIYAKVIEIIDSNHLKIYFTYIPQNFEPVFSQIISDSLKK